MMDERWTGVGTKEMKRMTILLDEEADLLSQSILKFVEQGILKNFEEFFQLVQQKQVEVNGEIQDVDDLDRVLFNEDQIRIGNKGIVRINK